MEVKGGPGEEQDHVETTATATATAAVRIFVGGVGEKVTQDDLQKTFSSLGAVKDVEFVRSNGRSFAYINFQPSSDKSLSKLFSSYNGCVWKGGKLRLEKAKEHYMARLRREWEEDAEVPHKTEDELVAVADENKDVSKKSKLLTLENKQLQIFFPRLRKVKAVPYSGTGKHKYSFQRVQVPPLPVHFCDCEEHCVPSETAEVKQMPVFEDQTGVVNEEELDMMRSVMNKIFNKEVNTSPDHSKAVVPTEGGSSNHPIDDMPPSGYYADQDDEDDDDDNLVINIGSGGNTNSGLVKNESLENVIQEAKLGKRRPSDVGSTQNRVNDQKENNNGVSKSSATTSNKKPRRLSSDESNGNEFTSTMPQKKGNPETDPKESKGLPAAQSDQKGSSQQLGKGLSWKQRSSWKDLVGETGNSSFNISYILPNASLKQDILKSNGFDTAITNDNNRQKVKKRVRFESTNSEPLGLPKDEILQDNVSTDGPSSDTQNLVKQGSCETAGSEPLGLTKDEILLDKVTTDSPSIGTQKVKKRVRFESTNSEPLGLPKDEILQDNVSTDGPSSDTQNLVKQGSCETAGFSELLGLTKDEIVLDKVTTDSPSIGTQKLMNQKIDEFVGSEHFGLVKDEIIQDKVSTDSPSIAVQSQNLSKESEPLEEVQPTEPKAGNNQAAGPSWIQKSSWTKLVGDMDNGSFSISNILPDIAYKKQNLQNHSNAETVNPFDKKLQNSIKPGNGSTGVGMSGVLNKKITPTGSNKAPSAKRKDTLVALEGVTNTEEASSGNEKTDITECSKSFGSASVSASNKTPGIDTEFGKVCTFMRSKESEKEWLKLRAALSVGKKKKSDEK